MRVQGRGWREYGLLGLLLVTDSLLAVLVARCTPFSAPNDEYLHEGILFAAKHRIADDFLPVGYSSLLGLAERFDGHTGVVVLSVALSLLVIVAAWFYLRLLGVSVPATFAITGLLSIYPDFLLSLHKAQDTEVTAALLFAFVSLLLKAAEETRFGAADLGLALTLSYAVLVRPNLLLLVGVCWLMFWRSRTPKAVARLSIQMLVLVLCYLGVTTAVHGRPFLPQYGPYNFYAGFNERTQDFPNEEDSLFIVLPQHHVAPPNGEPSFSMDNLRDPSLDPIYMHLALQFLREHPAKGLMLVGVKFRNLMGPNFSVHRAASAAGVVKILMAFGVPLWVIALVKGPHLGPPQVKMILLVTVGVYILPFLLTVSHPRFREPLDLLCWVDLGGIVYAWRVRSAAAVGSSLDGQGSMSA